MSDECNELIVRGKRSMVVGELAQAVESYQKACELLAKEHGDLDDRLAEPNLLYGSALLELARMEAPVIGNALDGVPEDDDESDVPANDTPTEEEPAMTAEDREDLSNQVIDAMCNKPDETNEVENGDDKKMDTEEATKETEKSENGKEVEDAPAETEEAEGEEEEEEEEEEGEDNEAGGEDKPAENNDAESEDEVTNLQLAWEVIEVSKQIYTRNKDNLKIADCLEKLAEISREKEDYEQAITDLSECMSVRKSVLDKDNREIAETHYQLGTTYVASGDLDKASESFKEAITVLKRFLDNVRTDITRLEKLKDGEEELERQRFTLKEIETLLPDLERRLVEVDEDRIAGQLKESTSGTTEQVNSEINATNEPAGDITHLVRKKRQVDTGAAEPSKEMNGSEKETVTSPESKKMKLAKNGSTESSTNGTHEQNGISNGNHVNGVKVIDLYF